MRPLPALRARDGCGCPLPLRRARDRCGCRLLLRLGRDRSSMRMVAVVTPHGLGRWLGVESVCFVAPIAFAAVLSGYSRVGLDTWWTLEMGRLIAETRAIPRADPFTFAPQLPGFVATQWLAQLLYYAPYPWLGIDGVVLLSGLMVVGVVGCLTALAWKRSGNMPVAALCATGAILLLSTSLLPRAQTLAFLLFALTCLLLYTEDTGQGVGLAQRRSELDRKSPGSHQPLTPSPSKGEPTPIDARGPRIL